MGEGEKLVKLSCGLAFCEYLGILLAIEAILDRNTLALLVALFFDKSWLADAHFERCSFHLGGGHAEQERPY